MARTKRRVLVETALLGQGLVSISDRDISKAWNSWAGCEEVYPVWMENGQIVSGGIEEFLALRRRGGLVRVTGGTLEWAARNRADGCLTASGVMRLMSPDDIAVTAGMGGIRGERVSDDLLCLAQLDVRLVASAPKDVFDIAATIAYLRENGVVINCESGVCDGFLFYHSPLDMEVGQPRDLIDRSRGVLYLQPLEPSYRIENRELLAKAVREGEEAERQGLPFHPAVNAALDRMTGGLSSRAQLHALLSNIGKALQEVNITGGEQ